MNNIERLRHGLSPERKRRIAAQTAAIVAEKRLLQEIGPAHNLTQKKMAEVLGIGHDSVSRLEQRCDLAAAARSSRLLRERVPNSQRQRGRVRVRHV